MKSRFRFRWSRDGSDPPWGVVECDCASYGQILTVCKLIACNLGLDGPLDDVTLCAKLLPSNGPRESLSLYEGRLEMEIKTTCLIHSRIYLYPHRRKNFQYLDDSFDKMQRAARQAVAATLRMDS